MLQHIALRYRKASLWSKAIVLVTIGLVPALAPTMAMAAPATLERELRSTTARPGIATDLTWIFDTPDTTATNLTKIEIEFCDAPLTECDNAVGTNNSNGAADHIPIVPASPTATLSGPWSSTPNTATRVAGADGGVDNQIDITLTTPGDNDNKDELQIAITGFTNDEQANVSYYTRMRLYDGATLVYEGVSAQSTSQTLTVNARVQERLDFCVGSTTLNDATSPAPVDCDAVSGDSVDIGNIENGFTNVSPVAPLNGGDNNNGIAMVRTNAVNGILVSYKALQDTASGKLKVVGATCSGSATTDQCFNNSATPGIFTAGTENFGMVVAGINCESTTAYTCLFSNGDYNLKRTVNYDGAAAPNNTFVAEADQESAPTTTQFAWDDNGVTAADIASSTGSTVKVVDDEALILKFAATAGVTTPTGSYTVLADFIATATF